MKNIISILLLFCSTFLLAQKNDHYLQVSYSSICCGTPSTAPVMSYISQFQKKNKTKTLEVLQQSGLGREGEFNLYIGLDPLSKTQKTSFIKGLKTAIASQNTKRNQSSDGMVNVDSSMLVTKSKLSSIKNLTVYKYNLIK